METYNPPQIIEILARHLELSVAELSQQIGYGRPQAFYDVMNGKTKNISPNMAGKIISKFPEIRKSWLLTGEGEMLNTNNTIKISNTDSIKGNITAGNNNTISNIDEDTEDEYTESPIVYEKDVVNYEKGVPYYNVDFINGFEGVIEFTQQNPDYYINYPPANHCDCWVNATGDSMLGVVNHGDTVALKQIDKEWFPLGEVYAIVTTNGHRMIKRISKSEDTNCYKLVSANPNKDEYPDQDIPKKYILHLFKVINAIKIIN